MHPWVDLGVADMTIERALEALRARNAERVSYSEVVCEGCDAAIEELTKPCEGWHGSKEGDERMNEQCSHRERVLIEVCAAEGCGALTKDETETIQAELEGERDDYKVRYKFQYSMRTKAEDERDEARNGLQLYVEANHQLERDLQKSKDEATVYAQSTLRYKNERAVLVEALNSMAITSVPSEVAKSIRDIIASTTDAERAE